MEYFISIFKKAVKSTIVTTILILLLWGALWKLTDFVTIKTYVITGIAVCILNTLISNLREHKTANLLKVQSFWVIMAGVVLVLYHAGFEVAAVFVAAAILVSPLFWATIYEGIVGFTLLINLAKLIL